MKKHTVSHWGKYSPPAYVSNGFIGFRFPKNPFREVIGLLGGFTALREKAGVEAFSVVPAPVIEFEINGKTIEPEILRQTYDFSCGELETEAVLPCGGKNIKVFHTVYCSRTSPALLVTSLAFQSETACRLKVNVAYAVCREWGETVSETKLFPALSDNHDGKCLVFSSDKSTSAGIAFRVFGDVLSRENSDAMAGTFETETGKEIQIVTSYIPGVMHSEPHNQAQRMVKLAAWNGMQRLRERNKKAWEKLWESRIVIHGAGEEWQDTIDASYFYLMTSASEFSPISVPPFGLSNPDAYEGHCFWDTESFMFMTPLFCAPAIARNMLDYRFKRKEAAENNAKLNGYRGIQFPWQSGASGSEVTVPWASGAAEHHVNLDVALAFDAYARVSGDEGYLRECVWPIMRGVSEWIESRVEKTERGYEILHVTGIDEEIDDVSNDSYTNILSAKILRSSAEYSVMLGFGERKKWMEISHNMFIPIRKDGVLEQYEKMEEREKQASTTLMAHFPYGFSSESDRATFEYYIGHGMENYLRYPMLSGFLGVFPAWLGNRKKALDFYEKANLTFFCEPFYSCTEWSIENPKDRIEPTKPLATDFITARGSLLMGLIMGLAKICPWKGEVTADVGEWLGENIVLPEGWNKITVGKIFLRGKAYRLTAKNGAKRATLEEIGRAF